LALWLLKQFRSALGAFFVFKISQEDLEQADATEPSREKLLLQTLPNAFAFVSLSLCRVSFLSSRALHCGSTPT
jgi:hypothetical protein